MQLFGFWISFGQTRPPIYCYSYYSSFSSSLSYKFYSVLFVVVKDGYGQGYMNIYSTQRAALAFFCGRCQVTECQESYRICIELIIKVQIDCSAAYPNETKINFALQQLNDNYNRRYQRGEKKYFSCQSQHVQNTDDTKLSLPFQSVNYYIRYSISLFHILHPGCYMPKQTFGSIAGIYLLMSFVTFLFIFLYLLPLHLLLIKSMSKIKNQMSANAAKNQQSNISSKPLKVALQTFQHKQKNANSETVRSISGIIKNQNQIDVERQDQYSSNKSRFQPWNLVQGAENSKVQRETSENRPATDKNFQLSNQLNEQEFQFNTPLRYESSGLSERKGPGFSTPKKETIQNLTSADKRSRPKEKGLRKLSARAFQIVKEMGEATYKQVAIKLIQDMDEDESEGGEEKQENNIKRRVYDALNVLIAMQILQKKGRFIVYDKNSGMASQQSKYLELIQEKNKILQEHRKKEEEIRDKKVEISIVKQKIQRVKKLINRNQKSDKSSQRQRIQFPFVCLFVHAHPIHDKMNLSPNKANFAIETTNSYSFFGDVDFLLKHPSKLA